MVLRESGQQSDIGIAMQICFHHHCKHSQDVWQRNCFQLQKMSFIQELGWTRLYTDTHTLIYAK